MCRFLLIVLTWTFCTLYSIVHREQAGPFGPPAGPRRDAVTAKRRHG